MVTRTPSELTICLPGDLDDLQRRRSAELVFDAGRGYYDLIAAQRAVVEAQIAKQIGQSGTELENVFIVLADSEVAGLHACVSTEVLPYVMIEGSLRLIRGFESAVRKAFLARLKQARPALPSLPERSLYLARMAVADGFRLASLTDGISDAHRGVADCLRAAFEVDPDRDIEAGLRSIEGNPLFDPELNIIAISPDGRVAA